MTKVARRGIGIAVLCGGVAFPTAVRSAESPTEAAPAGEPLSVDPTALLPLDDQSAVTIRGIRGQITVESIDARELRLVSRRPGPDGAELPVGLWQAGNK